MLSVDEIDKVHESVHDYLVLVFNQSHNWEEVVMVGSIKKENYNLLTYTEVYL